MRSVHVHNNNWQCINTHFSAHGHQQKRLYNWVMTFNSLYQIKVILTHWWKPVASLTTKRLIAITSTSHETVYGAVKWAKFRDCVF